MTTLVSTRDHLAVSYAKQSTKCHVYLQRLSLVKKSVWLFMLWNKVKVCYTYEKSPGVIGMLCVTTYLDYLNYWKK